MSPAAKKKASKSSFTAAEKAAMKERAKELKAEAKGKKAREDGEKEILAKIKEMRPADRKMAKRIHEIVTKAAPELTPRTWYGMPAYANDDGKVVCFFKDSGKFDARYSTFEFNDAANLDKGSMWPVSFALTKLTGAGETEVRRLVKQATS